MSDDTLSKVALTVLVVVVGTPTLPLTGGVSAVVLLGIVLAIWGYDDIV